MKHETLILSCGSGWIDRDTAEVEKPVCRKTHFIFLSVSALIWFVFYSLTETCKSKNQLIWNKPTRLLAASVFGMTSSLWLGKHELIILTELLLLRLFVLPDFTICLCDPQPHATSSHLHSELHRQAFWTGSNTGAEVGLHEAMNVHEQLIQQYFQKSVQSKSITEWCFTV